MPTASIDGITTRYQILGDGPSVLFLSPGGFDAALDNWSTMTLYRRIGLVEHLSATHRCILFDKRESGESGGRVERITWDHYARQGLGLLDHLGIDDAHVLGGCVGCSIATVMAVAAPERVRSMVLYSPAGGARYRITQHARFAHHQAHVEEAGPPGVVELARSHDLGFSKDPRIGPWANLIRRDDAFASTYARLDRERYVSLVAGLVRGLFDRDTAPGPEPEDLLGLDVPALVVPGQDASHATSAARYLGECLPAAQYWDVPVAEQTAETAPGRVATFLREVDAGRQP